MADDDESTEYYIPVTPEICQFEELEFPPPQEDITLSPTDGAKTFLVDESIALNEEDFKALFDVDGRLVEEHQFRKAIFRGGIARNTRKEAWPFLFELYPFYSTKRERKILLDEYNLKYTALKNRWKTFVAEHAVDGEFAGRVLHPAYLEDVPFTPVPSPDPVSPDASLNCMKIQAEIHAGRLEIDKESLASALRIIDKDVPRTDRNIPYFSGDTVHLRMLRNALITYAATHPYLGYTQGMNDILSRFLTVFDSEVEAYWCFEKYMDRAKEDFMADGLLNKLVSVKELLQEIDKDLMAYLEQLGVDDMTFCHRWMLLSFKREFCWEESMRCFEILSSCHLELQGEEAARVRSNRQKQHFELQEGESRAMEVPSLSEFTFEVFMCVTILLQLREDIFNCKDPSDVFSLISSQRLKLELQPLLRDAEVLFHKYCKKSVDEGYELVDHTPHIPKPRKKIFS